MFYRSELMKSVRARMNWFIILNFVRRGCASACLFSIVFCLLRVLRYVFCSDPVRSYARVSDGVYFDLCAARVCVCVGL